MIVARRLVELGLLALVAWPACKTNQEARARYDCLCPFLTDMDDPSAQRVRVCAPKNAVESTAIGCAQAAAPASIQSCACTLTPEPCAAPNECVPVER